MNSTKNNNAVQTLSLQAQNAKQQAQNAKQNGSKRFAKIGIAIAAIGTTVACSTAIVAPTAQTWTLDTSKSTLNFVTTKAGQAGVGGITETMTFKRYSGGLDQTGKIQFAVDLASIDSGVEIRDDRMKTMLWNVKATPQAVFTAKLSSENMATLNANNSVDLDLAGQFELAGQSKPVSAKVRASRMGNSILVVTRSPVVINSNDYGIRAGVEALRDVMGLNFLASSAPVNFALVLNAQK